MRRAPATNRALLERVAHVLAGVLDLLADLAARALDALALTLGLHGPVMRGPADVLLGPAASHHELVPHLVDETHVVSFASVKPLYCPADGGLTGNGNGGEKSRAGDRMFISR